MIRDGTGTGNLVRVGSLNRMDISSRSNRRIYYASRDLKTAFTENWAHQSSGSTNTVGYLTYTGDDNLYIDKIIVVSEDNTSATTLCKFGIWTGTTFSGGTLKVPVNMNVTSSVASNVSAYEDADSGTGTITSSGGNPVGTIRIMGAGTYEWIFDGAIILGKNNTFGVKASVTNGKKTRVTIQWWEE